MHARTIGFIIASLIVTASVWRLTACERAILMPGALDAGERVEPVGPMVGHVTAQEARLWMWTAPAPGMDERIDTASGGEHQFEVRIYEATGRGGFVRELFMDADPDAHNAATITVGNLNPDTKYGYEIRLADDPAESWKGSFRTAPLTGARGTFTMAVSSCMHFEDDQSSWDRLREQRPAFHLLLGDNVYADTTDREIIWQHHLRYRRVPEFAQTIANVPTYAMWDDHDYGQNNSDGTQPGKADSLRAFREVWANPAAGTDEVEGAFYRFSWGDVDFFVLDGRYERSPNDAPDDERKRMLGDGQFAWLAKGLRESTATFKVLASGSAMFEPKPDSWRTFTFARRRLLRLIADERITGVMYLCGDMHFCAIREITMQGIEGYPLIEVISSGITRGEERGFATLRFDLEKDDPTVEIRLLRGDGSKAESRTLKASELRLVEWE